MLSWRPVEALVPGGQAEIWLVEDTDTGERVIMKKLLRTPQLADPDVELRRFRREIRAQRSLSHPGIMPVLDIDDLDGTPVYFMPVAEKTLEDEILAGGGFSPAAAITVLGSIVNAVHHAHQQGIHHRDLKPPNVLMVDGRWVVGDFGLCRDIHSDSTVFTRTGNIIGTIAYMAPEQYEDGHSTGPQVDVFALGRIFYYMLTARHPLNKLRVGLLPVEYRALFERATADDPADRYPSVAEFGRALEVAGFRLHEPTPSVERARELLAAVLDRQPGAAGELLALLNDTGVEEYGREEEALLHFITLLPPAALTSLHKVDKKAFRDLLLDFDVRTLGTWPGEFADMLVDFHANVYATVDDPDVGAAALDRIADLGLKYRRTHGARVFARLALAAADPDEALPLVRATRRNSSFSRWLRGRLARHQQWDEVERVLYGIG